MFDESDENDGLRASALRSVREGVRTTGPRDVDVWRDLIDGRIRVVDRFRVDGQSFIVLAKHDGYAPPLSRREIEVATAAARGSSLKSLGFELGIRTSTVCDHLRSFVRKTGLANRKELVLFFSFRDETEGTRNAALW